MIRIEKTKNFVKLLKILTLVFVANFATEAFAQQTNQIVSAQEQLSESVRLAPCKMEDRLAAVEKLFETIGAKKEDILIEKFNKDKIRNLVVKKAGKSTDTIVVSAHYDKTSEGCGVIDNWTGISILAHLYRSISRLETEKSYIFVAFDQEEKGLLGSAAMARSIPPEQRAQYCSVVNLDSFGRAIVQAMANSSSNKLIKIAEKLAKDAKLPFGQASIQNADADSSSFKKYKIPAITFHGLDNDWPKYLHNGNDKFEKVNLESVYYGYRFALFFLTKLDKMPCAEIAHD